MTRWRRRIGAERLEPLLAETLAARIARTERLTGVPVSIGSLWRFFARRRITLKKSRRTRPSSGAPTS